MVGCSLFALLPGCEAGEFIFHEKGDTTMDLSAWTAVIGSATTALAAALPTMATGVIPIVAGVVALSAGVGFLRRYL